MATIEAVIDTSATSRVAPWSLPPEPGSAWTRLHSEISMLDTGLVVAEIGTSNQKRLHGTPEIVLERFTRRLPFIAPGGLMVRDGKRIIAPSCCVSVESWRDWFALFSGGNSPWMGHDPSPWVQRIPQGFRVWSSGGMREHGPTAHISIDFSEAELRFALDAVHEDLLGFRATLDEWASALAPSVAAQFVAAIDLSLAISDATRPVRKMKRGRR